MIDANTENKDYSFTFTYGAVTQTLPLKVETRTYRTGYTSNASAAIAQSHRSAAALSAFDNIIKSQLEKTSSVALWKGKFGFSVTDAVPQYSLGFGHSRTITSTGETYQNLGVDYYVAAGSDIIATNNGKVLYVGAADFPGKFVIIDHGLGLFSVYMHLADYTVKEGDMVEKGTVIGSAGTSGFIASTGANHSIMYFQNGDPFCGYELEEIGIPGLN
jgi:murein DD-endopeptidase MepM/ murein hydrolase activator NlpD